MKFFYSIIVILLASFSLLAEEESIYNQAYDQALKGDTSFLITIEQYFTSIDSDDSYAQYKGYYIKGFYFWMKKDFVSSVKHYLEAIDYAKLLERNDLLIPLYKNVGVTLEEANKSDLAYFFYMQCLKLSEAMKTSRPDIYIELAKCHKSLGNLDSANFYIQESISHNQSNEFDILSNSYMVLSDLNELESDIATTKKYLKKAISLTNNSRTLAYTYNRLGYVFLQSDQIDSAKHYLNIGLSMNEDTIGMPLIMQNLLINLADAEVKEGNYKKAVDYLNNADQLAGLDLEVQYYIHKELKHLFRTLGNNELFYQHDSIAEALTAEIVNRQNDLIDELNGFRLTNTFDAHNQKIEQIAQARLNRITLLTIAIPALLVLLIAIVFWQKSQKLQLSIEKRKAYIRQQMEKLKV